MTETGRRLDTKITKITTVFLAIFVAFVILVPPPGACLSHARVDDPPYEAPLNLLRLTETGRRLDTKITKITTVFLAIFVAFVILVPPPGACLSHARVDDPPYERR